MESLDSRVATIRARHAAATRGPWKWFGYTETRYIELSGADTVMEFRRWGMRNAAPVFCTRGILQSIEEVVAPDTCPGRGRITEINHPDARFIAGAWQDVADLLARIEQLEAALAAKATP